jgi:hypothetical protein
VETEIGIEPVLNGRYEDVRVRSRHTITGIRR